jgi:large subunit ribosomal protein L28
MMSKYNRIFQGFKTFKRANRGLYGDSMIRFGETVSEMGNRTKRSFKPNIQYASLYSEQLGQKVKVRLAACVLQRIDEAGGLDAYILNQPVPESWFAEKLKFKILMAKHQAELRREGSNDISMFNAA